MATKEQTRLTVDLPKAFVEQADAWCAAALPAAETASSSRQWERISNNWRRPRSMRNLPRWSTMSGIVTSLLNSPANSSAPTGKPSN